MLEGLCASFINRLGDINNPFVIKKKVADEWARKLVYMCNGIAFRYEQLHLASCNMEGTGSEQVSASL